MTTLKFMSITQCAKKISIKHEKTLLTMLLAPTPALIPTHSWLAGLDTPLQSRVVGIGLSPSILWYTQNWWKG